MSGAADVVGVRGRVKQLRACRRLVDRLGEAAAPAGRVGRTTVRRLRVAPRRLIDEGPTGFVSLVLHQVDPRLSTLPFWEDRRYRRWLRAHAPRTPQLRAMRAANRSWAFRPLVSVVVPVYNPEPAWLDAMIRSVRAQVYERWELCLADDRSPRVDVRTTLTEWSARDPRIKVVFRGENGNIAAASNSALQLATGEYVALLDHDDVLQPHALHRVVEALQGDPSLDVIYSDEDKVLVNGKRGAASLKGCFDPDHLLGTNYICHLSVLRRRLVDEIGGFRPGFDGSQDHDLLLRAGESTSRIHHIADVLYSWQQVPGSAALQVEAKPAAWSAGLRAVQDALDRRDTGGEAHFGAAPGLYEVRYPVPRTTRVSVVMLADSVALTRQALGQLRDGAGAAEVQWLVGTSDAGAEPLRAAGATLVDVSSCGGVADALNLLAARATGEILVFVGPGLVPHGGGDSWLTPLLGHALRDHIGAVGARIVAAGGKAHDEGLHVGRDATVRSIGSRYPVARRVAAVSSNCMAIGVERFAGAGGFDPRFRATLHDVDLCLRLGGRGFSTLYSPQSELLQLQSIQPQAHSEQDLRLFRTTWAHGVEPADPWVSPWLASIRPLRFN